MIEIRTYSRATACVAALIAVALHGSLSLAGEPAKRGFAMREPGPGYRLQEALATLDLTSSQQSTIEGILAERRDSAIAGMKGHMAAEMALRQQIESATFDERAIREAAAAVGAMQADRAVAEAAMLRDVRAVLTADQRSKLQEAMSRPEAGPHMEGVMLEKMRSPE